MLEGRGRVKGDTTGRRLGGGNLPKKKVRSVFGILALLKSPLPIASGASLWENLVKNNL